MNYYPHHIGDYAKDTGHLTWDEDMAYTRLLRAYYSREGAIPPDQAYRLARAATRGQREAVDSVLREFFERREDGWHNKRADAELALAHEKSEKARTSAAKRWQSNSSNANAMRTHSEGNAPNNQEPIANNQKPRTRSSVPSANATGTGGTPPNTDPAKDEIWKTGRGLLEAEGKSREGAGSFLGKLVKDYGQVLVLAAVRDCVTVAPAKPSEWLVARCQERREPANKQEALERRNAEAVKRFLEQEEKPVASH